MASRVYKHIDGVKVKPPCFSECRKFRYRLDIEKEDAQGGKCVCAILEHSSEADRYKADRSVQFTERIVFERGHPEFRDVNKLIIVNQYAFVKKIGFSADKCYIGDDNNKYIKNAIRECDIILIAWGKTNKNYERIEDIENLISKFASGKCWLKTGFHPRNGYKNNPIDQYDIGSFLN